MLDRAMSDAAAVFGEVARSAIRAAGGFDLVMVSETDPAVRTRIVEPLLADLGAWELDPTASMEDLEAAASLCATAGAFALPFPVAERLSRRPSHDDEAIALIAGERPLVNMLDLPFRWFGVDETGAGHRLTARGGPAASLLGMFLSAAEVAPTGLVDPDLVTRWLLLNGFLQLGMLRGAFELTLAHARTRRQFGAELVTFQAVQYQLADARVAVEALDELARYALWSFGQRRANRLVDAVGLRVEAIAAADVVFRTAHQLHGATGFCDETSVSWLSRHSQIGRRLPFGAARGRRWLAELTLAHGHDGLFSAGGVVQSTEPWERPDRPGTSAPMVAAQRGSAGV